MSRDFGTPETDYFKRSAAVVSTGPLTLACWFNMDVTSGLALTGIYDSGAANDSALEMIMNGTSVQARAVSDAGSLGTASQGSASTDTWHHAAAQFISTTSRYAFLDGSKGTQGTDTISWPTALDSTTVGVRDINGLSNGMDGEIAEVGIWDVALSDAEIASLAVGTSPLMVRPQSLIEYWPLHNGSGAGDEFGWVGANVLTENGTVTATEHPPRIIYPQDQMGVIRIPWTFEPDWVGPNARRFDPEIFSKVSHP